jgi:sigma-B regulation protein RsbU (phosphoserine phosphatase)
VLGDVCGKGAQAAKTTALARYTLRAAAVQQTTPSTILRTLNAALREWFGAGGGFATVVYASVRLTARGVAVRLANGGHPPAYLRRVDGTVLEFGRNGTLLGGFVEVFLRDQRTVLAPGDALVLYTDGVTEASPAGTRDLFGEERLIQTLRQTAADATAAQIAEALETAVLTHSAGYLSDDTAILVLRNPG